MTLNKQKMSSNLVRPSKHTKPQNPSPTSQTPSRSSHSSSSLSSHLAMVELKQKIFTSISKLSDRDTHQVAITDLESIISSLSSDSIPMFLNCLYDAASDPKAALKKESLRLFSVLCKSHSELTFTHLPKIIAAIVKRLKDADSGVRDACRDAIGSLSGLYLKGDGDGNNGGGGGGGSVVGLFVRPLFEAMNEQNKCVQSGAAICMGRMVECAGNPPVAAFQKLGPRICKLLSNQNFMANAALLPVVASLAQVGALAPQSMEPLLQNIHECLGSADWATRKAAADALSAIASHSSSLITEEEASSTLTVLEAFRFDKIKPARDSMIEALQLWKTISGKQGGASGNQNTLPQERESSKTDNTLNKNVGEKKIELTRSDSSNGSPTSGSLSSNAKGGNLPDKAVGILKKKVPALTDKEINPEFFQKLETHGANDLPVEVVVPRKCQNSSNPLNEDGLEPNGTESRRKSSHTENFRSDDFKGSSNNKYHNTERGIAGLFSQFSIDGFSQDRWGGERINTKDSNTRALDVERESCGLLAGCRNDGQPEGSFMDNRGNWLAIQRQLSQLERQQTHLLNMLQDFMGGSHDSMITLESRVRGLERVVEDMALDLSISSSRRGGSFVGGFDGSSSRSSSKYNGYPDYSGAKFGRDADGRASFGERFPSNNGYSLGTRGKVPTRRSDMSDDQDFHAYGTPRNGQTGWSRRPPTGGSVDLRSDHNFDDESDQVGNRRAWDKGTGHLRLGEGPSSRSVWKASKDEATLEAIRVAGEDNGSTRTNRIAIPEMTAEAIGDDSIGRERDPVRDSWRNAMDALHIGDIDSAFAEVLSTGDDFLLVKLMDRTGPVVDQLSNEIACGVLHAVGQFLQEQNLFDMCLSWVQQLVYAVVENGADGLHIPMEVKRVLLLNLHKASLTMDLPDDLEGASPEQLMLQLASAWEIDLQQFKK